MGDPVFDTFYASQVQYISNDTYQQSTIQAAGAVLLDRINRPAVIIGHSQGGVMPILIADARPELTKALILIEPAGPPFQNVPPFGTNAARLWGLTDIPLRYSPPVNDPEIDLIHQVYPPPVPNKDNSTMSCILQALSPPPKQLLNLVPIPILVINGEASLHAPYDYCVANYLKQAGCNKTDYYDLGSVGIKGNGHMMFLERNSDEIQAFLKTE